MQIKLILYMYEKFYIRPHFETEAKGNLENGEFVNFPTNIMPVYHLYLLVKRFWHIGEINRDVIWQTANANFSLILSPFYQILK